jgi:hypothetical protein
VPNASSKRSRIPSRASMPGTAFITTEVAGQYCRATRERSDSSNRSDRACEGVADEACDEAGAGDRVLVDSDV